MLDSFNAILEAKSPERRHFRTYGLDVGVDLLGHWIVDVTFGRIGCQGRCIRYYIASENDARRLIRAILRRRAGATKRIGTGYQFRVLHDPNHWLLTCT